MAAELLSCWAVSVARLLGGCLFLMHRLLDGFYLLLLFMFVFVFIGIGVLYRFSSTHFAS